jgi:hypothetical protein
MERERERRKREGDRTVSSFIAALSISFHVPHCDSMTP